MTTYIDVETSPDAIQEDEELIEAVEALVETAAVSVWSEIQSDLEHVRSRCERFIEMFFPILLDYREDRSRVKEDLEKLAIFLVLLVAAFCVLAPTRTKRKLRRQRSWLIRRSDSWSSSHPTSESESDSISFQPDDETDEERFDKVWSQISLSRYRKLVLPPSCRLVEKPKQAVVAASAKKEPRVVVVEERDEDNPAMRLQTYVRQFLYFLKSIISYDYAGAGWTLIFWMQGIRRYRRTTSRENLEEDGESTSSEATQRRRTSKSSSEPLPIAAPLPTVDETDSKDKPSRALSPFLERDEEKFDGEASVASNLSSPPRIPSIRRVLDRKMSDGSVYYESEQANEKATPKSPVATKLLKRLSVKRKDALKSYQPTHDAASIDSALRTPPRAQRVMSAPAVLPSSSGLEDTKTTDSSTTSLSSLAVAQHVASESKQELIDNNHATTERFFFETAHTHDSLKKLSIDVPVPDKNGYILGDDFLPDSRYTPLLVFVNSRSGPQQGHLLLSQLKRLLNPIQIWDLGKGGPEPILESFLVLTRLRILVCGGDGTVSWIVSTLEKMNLQRKWPPIALLPLGTGNDLARIHGWGGGYNNESLITILEQISESYISLLDRWEVQIDEKAAKKSEKKTFFNYLGVGADAQAALQVHYLRESRPDWFFSRLINKAWYGIFGAEDMIMASSVSVRKDIKLVADGVEVTLPPDSQGIIVLNIDSYAGGVPLWSHGTKPMPRSTLSAMSSPRRSRSMQSLGGRSNSIDRVDSLDDLHLLPVLSDEDRFDRVTACDRPSSCQDGILEIVSIRGAFHLGQIKVGLSNAQRLCQCREAKITIKSKVAVQIDGEPWRQRPCTLTIKRKKDPAVMLHRSADDGGVETEMSKLLDWAEERQLIDGQVHAILMKEFSRRIESKTRKRRVREQDNIMHTLKKAISQGAMANMQGSSHWQGGIAF